MMVSSSKKRTRNTWWQRTQPEVWNFLNNPSYSKLSKVYGFVSLMFVLLSIFSFFADTSDPFQVYDIIEKPNTHDTHTALRNGSDIINSTDYAINRTETNEPKYIKVKHTTLHIIDIICLVFFTIEYITRIVFAPRKLELVTSILGVIDILAILPDYIEIIAHAADPTIAYDTSAVTLMAFLKVFRVLRIFRLIRHVPGLWILVYTLKASVGELVLLVCFMVLGIMLFASLIFFVEDRKHFKSIPDGFWWALITMTTVGYGDMYPHTILGKLVGSLCALSGLLMIGFSVPALVNNFVLYYKHVQFSIDAEREESKSKNSDKTLVSNGVNHIEEIQSNVCANTPFIQRSVGQNTDDSKTEDV